MLYQKQPAAKVAFSVDIIFVEKLREVVEESCKCRAMRDVREKKVILRIYFFITKNKG